MIATRLIEDPQELEALADAWDALWRRARATPFQSPAWLLAWRRAFAPQELRCAAAFIGDRLVGLAPFYLERGPLGRRLLPLGISLSDYLDILVDPDWRGAGAALTDRLGEEEWDEWRLEALAPDAEALRLGPPAGVEESGAEQDVCPVIAQTGADLAASVPARQRRKLRRARTAAERRGRVDMRAQAPAGEFLDALFALHRGRWETRGESGVLADPAVQIFHRDVLPGLYEAGSARTFLMEIDGRPVGAYYGFAHRGRAYAYLGGFDADFEDASPGALTIEAALRDASSDGPAEFHFLRGREAYKYAWGATDRINRVRIWTRRHV